MSSMILWASKIHALHSIYYTHKHIADTVMLQTLVGLLLVCGWCTHNYFLRNGNNSNRVNLLGPSCDDIMCNQ